MKPPWKYSSWFGGICFKKNWNESKYLIVGFLIPLTDLMRKTHKKTTFCFEIMKSHSNSCWSENVSGHSDRPGAVGGGDSDALLLHWRRSRGKGWSFPRASSVHVAEVTDGLVLHDAQVVHGAAEGDLYGLPNAGCASFHHLDFVDGFVHPQRNHLGSRKPLPEENQKQTADWTNNCIANVSCIYFSIFPHLVLIKQ